MVLPDGRILAWREIGQGPVLVLVHGWAISGLAFAELVEHLKGQFRLLLPDLAGHGNSSPCRDASLKSLAQDLRDWLAVVASGPVSLGGWSLGGMVAMEMASEPFANLNGLILIGTSPCFTNSTDWAHGLPATQVKALRRNLLRRFETTLSDFFRLTFAGEEIDEERIGTIRRFAVYPGKAVDQQVASTLLEVLEQQDQRVLLKNLALPVLVIHGEHDQVTPLPAGEWLGAQLPEAKIEVIRGAGHAPFWSRPEQVVPMIVEAAATWSR